MNRRHCLDLTNVAQRLTDKEALKQNKSKQEHMRQLALAAPFLGFLVVLYLICALHFFGVIQ